MRPIEREVLERIRAEIYGLYSRSFSLEKWGSMMGRKNLSGKIHTLLDDAITETATQLATIRGLYK